MMAWLQRLLLVVLLAANACWWWWSDRVSLAMPWRLLGATVLLLPHAPVLALEFVLLACFGDPTPAARPSAMQLVRAWAGEVWWGILTFGWRQPFRSAAIPDRLGPDADGKPGVLLVHGFVCNRGIWNPWMRRLTHHGVPFVAVTLEPAFGSIEAYAESVDAAVARLRSATGRPPLIVAHSMGGLAARHWLRQRGEAAACAGIVTIGSPHQGTWLARFAFSRNGREMRQRSPWIADLNAQSGAIRADSPFVCYFSHCDNIVFPAAAATLEGADNRHLAGCAHVAMLGSPRLFDEVLQQLRVERRI